HHTEPRRDPQRERPGNQAAYIVGEAEAAWVAAHSRRDLALDNPKGVVMKKEHVNPASWQEKFGYSQGCRVDEAQRLLFVAGQIALDENGVVVGEGDFEAQTRQVFTNMGRVLELAGMSFESVVQIGGFLIDIGELPTYARVRA